MVIYDSVAKTKMEFVPIKEGVVKIYVCGPTVYDDAHLGHARSAISFDLLRRTLEAKGFEVIFARNITDIDDKIIDKMSNTGKSLEEITTHYATRYADEMGQLNVLEPTLQPKATENIDAMSALTAKLIANGHAYTLDDGIYFDTTKDKSYLGLSGKKMEKEDVINRAGAKESKRDFKDFALWKFSPIKPNFHVSFGDGRPGWHLECSAMINAHLAYHDEPYQIDIHAGGADLLFPHHENEAAQSRCAYNQELAKYWMHNGFVKIDGEKMSKSLGNSFFLKDALKVYGGEVIRFYLGSIHYRADFNFNEEDLLASKKRLDRIYRLKKLVIGTRIIQDEEFEQRIMEALNDDLNVSVAYAVIDEFINIANATSKPMAWTLSNIEFIGRVLGFGLQNPYEYFQFGVSDEDKRNIEMLIEQRASAKITKDFALADTIRQKLQDKGVSIMDTPNGTVWERNFER